jgi:hypothetical protein
MAFKISTTDLLGSNGCNGSLGRESDSGKSDTRISVTKRLAGPVISGLRDVLSGDNVDNTNLEAITPTDRPIISSRLLAKD